MADVISTVEEPEERRIFLGYFESIEKEDFKDHSRRQSETQQIAKLARISCEWRRRVDPNNNLYWFIYPTVVSIGPYHHINDSLPLMQDFKVRLAIKFVHTCGHHAHELYDNLFNEIQQMRDLYEKEVTIKYNDEQLTQVLFVDGCFVLYSIYCFLSSNLNELNMNEVDTRCDLNDLLNDMLKLENQLPFRVLELLLGENFKGYKKYEMIEAFIENIGNTLMPIFVRRKKFRLDPKNSIHLLQLLHTALFRRSDKNHSIHSLQLLHRGLFRRSNKKQMNNVSQKLILASTSCVTELKAAGIQCKPSLRRNFSYVTFNPHWFSRVLELPSIIVDGTTQFWFLNLLAYEKHLDIPVYEVQSYIRFLASLLQHPEDVKELQVAHILYNHIGDNEDVVRLFKEMAQNCSLVVSNSWYDGIKLQMEDYLTNRGKIKMALWLDEVIGKYFKSPWTAIALVAGFLVLSATILQTVYTILSYYHH